MAYLAGLIPFELLLTWLVERGILSEFTGSIIGLIYLPV